MGARCVWPQTCMPSVLFTDIMQSPSPLQDTPNSPERQRSAVRTACRAQQEADVLTLTPTRRSRRQDENRSPRDQETSTAQLASRSPVRRPQPQTFAPFAPSTTAQNNTSDPEESEVSWPSSAPTPRSEPRTERVMALKESRQTRCRACPPRSKSSVSHIPRAPSWSRLASPTSKIAGYNRTSFSLLTTITNAAFKPS
jgi:hypothetical protein